MLQFCMMKQQLVMKEFYCRLILLSGVKSNIKYPVS